jgi:isochorismate hydrolase
MRTILDNFSQHVTDVSRLIEFDREVMHVAISAVEDLHGRLVKTMQITNDQMNGGRTLQILRGVRDHESLKPRFSLILNQAVVLLVSYFGSAVEDIFSSAMTATLRAGGSSRLLKEDLKLTLGELMDAASSEEDALVALFIEKKDLSFQDMKAIHRAFREYIGVEMEKDAIVNNIILAQACRHVIVHAGGEITARLTRQVSEAFPRDIKAILADSPVIQFSQQEVQTIAESMTGYLSNLVMKTEAAIPRTSDAKVA